MSEDAQHPEVVAPDLAPADPTQWWRLLLGIAVTVDLLLMMGLTFVDVVGRYVFNSPLPGAKELTEILQAVLVFGAAPMITADRTHITTALFESVLSRKVLRWRDAVIALLGAIVCSVLAWRLWIQAGLVLALHEGTPLLGVPMAPFVYFMSAASAACALILLVHVVLAARGNPVRSGSGIA